MLLETSLKSLLLKKLKKQGASSTAASYIEKEERLEINEIIYNSKLGKEKE